MAQEVQLGEMRQNATFCYLFILKWRTFHHGHLTVISSISLKTSPCISKESKNDKFEEVASLMRLPKEFDLNVVSTSTAAGNQADTQPYLKNGPLSGCFSLLVCLSAHLITILSRFCSLKQYQLVFTIYPFETKPMTKSQIDFTIN